MLFHRREAEKSVGERKLSPKITIPLRIFTFGVDYFVEMERGRQIGWAPLGQTHECLEQNLTTSGFFGYLKIKTRLLICAPSAKSICSIYTPSLSADMSIVRSLFR